MSLPRMLSSLAFTTSIVLVREQEVDLALMLSTHTIRLRLSKPNENKAFARTRSFAIAHLDPLPSRAVQEQVVAFVRALARVDPGGVSLDVGPRKHLEVLTTVPGGSWSRDIFDANVEALRARGARVGAAVVVVTQACEMACAFCPSKDKQHEVVAEGGFDHHLRDLEHQLEAARSLGATRVEFGGNDVLRFPHLLALLETAKRLGFDHLSAQSPGQSLADRDFAEALSKSPLDALDVPIYGMDAAHHDAITGTEGSFDALLQALDHARHFGRPEIRLRTLALHHDALDLDALIAFAQKRFGLSVAIGTLRPNRVGERDHLRLAANFAELAALAAQHAERFEIEGPLCILPRERALVWSHVLTARQPTIHTWDLGIRSQSKDAAVTRERERLHLDVCERCAVRGGCAGILKSELDRFGAEGIAPFEH